MESFDSILKQHLPRIASMARSIHRGFGGVLDEKCLISAGTVGLWEVTLRYDPTKTKNLWDYASNRVQGSMMDELRFMDHISRDARHALKTGKNDFGVGLVRPCSLDEAIDSPENDDSLALCLRLEAGKAVCDAVAKLTFTHQRFVRKYYHEDLSLAQIARQLGVTTSRIHQIKKKVHKKLGKLLRLYFPVDERVRQRTPVRTKSSHKLKRNPRFVEFQGENRRLSELASEWKIKLGTLAARIRIGWTVERALHTPIKKIVERTTSIRSSQFEQFQKTSIGELVSNDQ
jgi:RNA polymerase sigma factor for flagellar operon FliA